MKSMVILGLALLCAGCASLADRQHAQELSVNREDNDVCVAKGLRYPSDDYRACRWSLQNERLRRQWRNTQMLQSAGKPVPTGVSGADYKPLDQQRFRCWPEPQFGGDYVFCGEDGGRMDAPR